LSLTWPIDFWAQLRRIDQNDHFKHEDHTFDATLMLANFMLDKLYLIIITTKVICSPRTPFYIVFLCKYAPHFIVLASFTVSNVSHAILKKRKRP